MVYVGRAYVFVGIVRYNSICVLRSIFSKTVFFFFFNLQYEYLHGTLTNLCMIYMRESEEMP